MITAPPLLDVTAVIAKVLVLYRNTPPLADWVYGLSAPEGGSLVGVVPSLTTFTKGGKGGSGGVAVTRLVTWVLVGEGGTYDVSRASGQAKSRASSVFGVGFVTGSQTCQGAGSTMCYGRGPCNGGVGRGVPVGFVEWCSVLGIVLGLFVL